MHKSNLTLILIAMLTSLAHAQNKAADLLQKSAASIKAYRYIAFDAESVTKNMLSDKDTAKTTNNETIVYDSYGHIEAQNISTCNTAGQLIFRSIYQDSKLYSLDMKDSIYNETPQPGRVSNTLDACLREIEYVINKKADKTAQLKNTLINNEDCYGFFVRQYDTVENNNHNFTYVYLYLAKKTLLPLYTRETGAGTAFKSGYQVGRINVFNEVRFSHYKLNKAPDYAIFRFNSAGFAPENKVMLAEGLLAPPITARDLNGNPLQPGIFKNKIMLLQFGSTTCAANPLATPVINRLVGRYNPASVAIICVYSDETSKQAKDYVEANHLAYPVYLGSSRLKKSFKTTGTPNFYLIDQRGVIVKSINGYSDHLEQELTTAIDRLVANNSNSVSF